MNEQALIEIPGGYLSSSSVYVDIKYLYVYNTYIVNTCAYKYNAYRQDPI